MRLYFCTHKNPRNKRRLRGLTNMVRPIGIEPTHAVPETAALSTELRAHMFQTTKFIIYENGA